MAKFFRFIIVPAALVAFVMAGTGMCAEFYVVKDASGKTVVVDAKPADAKSIVKGPFPSKEAAEKEMKAAATTSKPKPPDQGC
jgi:hypothetical protein